MKTISKHIKIITFLSNAICLFVVLTTDNKAIIAGLFAITALINYTEGLTRK